MSLLLANNRLPGHVTGTPALPPKADVVGGFRVERRIEIDQVNALGRDAIAENLVIVAVIECHADALPRLRPVRRRDAAAFGFRVPPPRGDGRVPDPV